MTGPVSGLVCGGIFGFALERAGFASGCKLTAQLRFTDWAVFKVMFTAILVAATGIWLLQVLGLLSKEDIFIPTTYFWATLLGGVGVGAGMAIGGYCPGTSVVSFMSGRLDGLVFFLGILVGTAAFAGVYTWIEPLMHALPGPEAQTVSELLGVPDWIVLVALGVVFGAVAWFTRTPVPTGTTPSNASPTLAHGTTARSFQ
ncbi:YeeE/YedE thiosulfate transporter family protein [Fontimonas thermophila]|uniref:YeeE/YedE thiosulfate transporter family protein n=1 Tax=Fontimonas thermophila TaxID=1076937 RepID=UPI001F2CBA9B|nr:YeeE/YedE thiosulfate transporter family protein [Fontimonas thermophila]